MTATSASCSPGRGASTSTWARTSRSPGRTRSRRGTRRPRCRSPTTPGCTRSSSRRRRSTRRPTPRSDRASPPPSGPSRPSARPAWPLLKLLRRIGIEPKAVGGHSFGELTALCAAGSMSPADLLKAARHRGERMRDASEADGAMLAVKGDLTELSARVEKLDDVVVGEPQLAGAVRPLGRDRRDRARPGGADLRRHLVHPGCRSRPRSTRRSSRRRSSRSASSSASCRSRSRSCRSSRTRKARRSPPAPTPSATSSPSRSRRPSASSTRSAPWRTPA